MTEMKAVDKTVTSAFAAGTPRTLIRFPIEDISYTRAYDIEADGSRFIIPGQAEIAPVEATKFEVVQGRF
jgi:hypothetical protein